MRVVIIDGEREATFAFLGAVHGLPVDHGLLFDLGGGSLEVTRFRARKLVATWTLPLGALRLSDRFLGGTGQPAARDVRRLRDFVVKTMRKAEIPRLERDEQLIGTGGTARNLAKMEARLRRDPLPHVHGYVLDLDEVRSLVQRTASLGQSARAGIPGLNKDRADSIVGGFLAVQTAMEFVGARQLQVSGQGLREGIALATLGKGPPPSSQVRRASIEALARRFSTCNREVARRRARIAARLLEILDPEAEPDLRETLQHVCLVIDIGRAVDYFDRFRNAAMILAAADLQGFTPRGVALAFAVLMQADNEANRLKALRPALRDKDGALVSRAAILLRVADEIERRSLPGQPLAVRFRLTESALVLNSEALVGWRPGSVGERFKRVFHRELRLVAR
jgi:exopolyphosphatase/guanosine-5'-triphosphate,3'-diphosphate pyrophosphatase